MRAILFPVLFYSWTTLMGVLVLPFLLGPPRLLLAYSRFWIRVSLWLLRVTVGLSHEVRGREYIPDGPALFAVKHQSAWDTLAINLIIRDAAIVLKRELTWIPVFGWCLLRARQIPIDRSGGIAALRSMVAAARDRLSEGRPVVIYPEGTRVAPGTAQPYHAGVAALQSACAGHPGGAEFRPVLAPPLTCTPSRPDHDRVPAALASRPATTRFCPSP